MELPLFPLNTVLFPSGTLPLHIFEERYKVMMAHCLERQSRFGVVLIKSGREVGGPAMPHDVGTVARIARVQRLPDGRLNLVAVGEERFRIVTFLEDEPYMRAQVELIDETETGGPVSEERAAEVVGLYVDYYHLALTLSDQWQLRVGVPQRPLALADFIATRLDVDPQLKQQLLETVSLSERLDFERDLLREAIRLLQLQVCAQRRQKYQSLSARN